MYNYEHIWTQSCTLKQNIFNEKFFSLRKYLFIWEGDFFVVKFIMKKKNELTAYLFLVYIKKLKTCETL